jgi:hypothetical protein
MTSKDEVHGETSGKPPGHRPGLPGKVVCFYIVPLDPAYKAGLVGHVPAKRLGVWNGFSTVSNKNSEMYHQNVTSSFFLPLCLWGYFRKIL